MDVAVRDDDVRLTADERAAFDAIERALLTDGPMPPGLVGGCCSRYRSG